MQNSQSGDEVAGRPIQESSSNALISVIAKKDVLSIGLNLQGIITQFTHFEATDDIQKFISEIS
jgi:hypothetical protein